MQRDAVRLGQFLEWGKTDVFHRSEALYTCHLNVGWEQGVPWPSVGVRRTQSDNHNAYK